MDILNLFIISDSILGHTGINSIGNSSHYDYCTS